MSGNINNTDIKEMSEEDVILSYNNLLNNDIVSVIDMFRHINIIIHYGNTTHEDLKHGADTIYESFDDKDEMNNIRKIINLIINLSMNASSFNVRYTPDTIYQMTEIAKDREANLSIKIGTEVDELILNDNAPVNDRLSESINYNIQQYCDYVGNGTIDMSNLKRNPTITKYSSPKRKLKVNRPMSEHKIPHRNSSLTNVRRRSAGSACMYNNVDLNISREHDIMTRCMKDTEIIQSGLLVRREAFVTNMYSKYAALVCGNEKDIKENIDDIEFYLSMWLDINILLTGKVDLRRMMFCKHYTSLFLGGIETFRDQVSDKFTSGKSILEKELEVLKRWLYNIRLRYTLLDNIDASINDIRYYIRPIGISEICTIKRYDYSKTDESIARNSFYPSKRRIMIDGRSYNYGSVVISRSLINSAGDSSVNVSKFGLS